MSGLEPRASRALNRVEAGAGLLLIPGDVALHVNVLQNAGGLRRDEARNVNLAQRPLREGGRVGHAGWSRDAYSCSWSHPATDPIERDASSITNVAVPAEGPISPDEEVCALVDAGRTP